MAMEAQHYRKMGQEVFWGLQKCGNFSGWVDKVITEPERLFPFASLPHPDRIWTRAKEYTSGNYKYLPGTHMQSARGCWWGKCTFCVENEKPYEVRPVEDVISEIEECKALGFKEVFDDSATFPIGGWLDKFLDRAIVKGFRSSIRLGCNMRICNIDYKRFVLAGFRMLLFGIESANQFTLDHINKGVKVENIIPTIKRASKCGLDCHGAFMFGYSWETDEDAQRTLKLCHYLLRKGYLKTAQASLYCPQGVPGNQAHKKYIKKIYNAGYYPEFWFHQLRAIKDINDIKYIWRGMKSAFQ